MKKCITIAILALIAPHKSESANFKFKICDNENDTNCISTDTLLKIRETKCDPESGKCKILARCNENLDFDRFYQQGLSDSDGKLSIMGFDFSDCIKGEILEIQASCTRNACINNDDVFFLDQEVKYFDTLISRKNSATVKITPTKKECEFIVEIQSSEQKYYPPVMTCSLYDDKHLMSRKTYGIGRSNNGNLEMLKTNKKYHISNGPLSWEWPKGMRMECEIHEYDDRNSILGAEN